MTLEFGLDTFGDVTTSLDGAVLSQAQVLRNVLDEAILADSVGVHCFGIGEHHREDFAVSAPEVVLAAIATRTKNLRLGSAVTVLSSDDPVRVFQRFATLDALSGGRAEVTLGRGSFTESFPLFGFELADYEVLFDERLNLFAQLVKQQPVTWSGTTRSALSNQMVYPLTESGHLRTWVGVGGSQESVIRAASYGFPLMMAIIGGSPARFRPLVDLFARALEHYGQAPQMIGVHSPGYIGASDAEARAELWPHMQQMRNRIGRERGWPPISEEEFEQSCGPDGSWYVGAPETVAKKIAATIRTLGLSRFDLKYSVGSMPHELLMGSIERYGTSVIPRVRELLGD